LFRDRRIPFLTLADRRMRSSVSILTITCLIAGSVVAAEPVSQTAAKTAVIRSSRSGAWLMQETANFRICTLPDSKAARSLPGACEALRSHLLETWFSRIGDDWSPKCDVVVHSTLAAYARALGAGSERSSGCATIEIEPGRVVKRRIDLRADAVDCFDCALPHELTHVVVAERFTRNRIPRWADEGMAILAETRHKQQQRRAAFERSLATSRPYSAAELTTLADYPEAGRLELFYGQSASFVAYLIERESPSKFLEFVELSSTSPAEQALAKVYGVRDWRELEVAWRTRMLTPGESAELLAGRVNEITAFRDID
jgi:hypothetical protein